MHPGAAPFDLGAVIEQVHFAYRPVDAAQRRFAGGHSTYAIEVDAVAANLTPYHAKRAALPSTTGRQPRDAEPAAPPAEVIAGAPLRLELESIARGERTLASADSGRARVERDGHLAIERREVVEHYQNRDDGVEQRWSFNGEPAGTGPLRVRLRARGLEYAGETAAGLHFADARTGLGFRYGHGTWVDAQRRETHVEARWADGSIELVVPAAVLHASAYPAVLDPTISPEFGVDQPVQTNARNAQVSPSVAFNGSDYLVVWVEWRDRGSQTTDIYGTRVTNAGLVSDPSGLVLSTATGPQFTPGVASNGSDYLVVWEDERSGAASDLYATRVTSAGLVLDPDGLALSTVGYNHRKPSVASNGTDYLVVWQDSITAESGALYGTRVTSAGAVMDPTGVALSTMGAVSSPNVTSNGSDYLVVWQDFRLGPSGDIYGTRVTSAGAVSDPSGLALTAAVSRQAEPSLASNGSDYLVVWEDYRNGPSADIYGTRVTSAGAVLEPGGLPLTPTQSSNQFSPSVASNGSDYLVVWEDTRTDLRSDIYGTRVTTAGIVVEPGGVAFASAAERQAAPSVASNGSDYLVVWEDRRSDFSDIYGTRVTSAAVVSDPSGFVVSTTAANEFSPSVAFNGGDYLVVWHDDRDPSLLVGLDVYGARVTSAGTVLDPSGLALATAAHDQMYPSVASNGSDYLVVWQDYRNSSGTNDIYGTRVTGAGSVLDPGGVALSTAGDDQTYPRVASDGSNYLVVWQDYRNRSGSYDIYGARVTNAGAVLDASGLALCTAACSGILPSVASSGSEYLVVWHGYNLDVYGTSVTSAGDVSNPGGLALSTVADAESVSVASNGSDYLVVWQDRRNSFSTGDDIYATRVTSAGVALNPSGFALSTAPGAQWKPSVASSGSDYLVVWQDARSGSAWNVYGTRVLSTGVEVPSGTPLAADPATREEQPRVAGGSGDSFLLVYQRYVPEAPFDSQRIRARLIQYGSALGKSCGSDGDCESGYCVDGVCCDSACGGGAADCQACSFATGAPSDGTCSALTGTPCNDGDICTASDSCRAGACTGSGNPCYDSTTCSPGAGEAHTCSACPPGTHSLDGTGTTDCVSCVAGMYSAEGAIECTACAPGTYSASGASTCKAWTQCSAGEYVASEGTVATDRICAACAPGTYSTTTNASSCANWIECVAGEYVLTSGTATTNRTCGACIGGYSTRPNATSCTAWTPCSAGHYLVREGTLTSDRVCMPCASGEYSTTTDAAACTAWTVCAAGEYMASAGTATSDAVCARCTSCPADTIEREPCTAISDTVCAPAAVPDAGTDGAVEGGVADGAVQSPDAADGSGGTSGVRGSDGSAGDADEDDAGAESDASDVGDDVATNRIEGGGCACDLGRGTSAPGAKFVSLGLAALFGRSLRRRRRHGAS